MKSAGTSRQASDFDGAASDEDAGAAVEVASAAAGVGSSFPREPAAPRTTTAPPTARRIFVRRCMSRVLALVAVHGSVAFAAVIGRVEDASDRPGWAWTSRWASD